MAQHGTTATTDPVEALVAAIGRLGQATPAQIAADADVAYSTTNKKLRDLAAAGRAEKFTAEDNRTLWRLTGPAGQDVKASDPAAAVPSGTDPVPAVPDEPDPAATDTDSVDDDSGDTVAVPAGDGGQPPEAGSPEEPTPPTVDPAAAEPTERVDPTGGVDEHADTAQDGGHQAADAGQPPTQASSGSADDGDPGADTPPAGAAPEPAGPAKARRASGSLDGAVLDILEPHPQRGFKVSELCKLIDKANEGTDAAKASPGAVVLAAQRLVRKGKAVLVVEKPATFQWLAPAGD